MTDVAAAIGLKQLERYPELLKRRREIIARYDQAMSSLGIGHLTHFSDSRASSGHLYITRVPGADRACANRVMERMAERGVTAKVHYKPLPLFTAYRALGFRIEDYPNAYRNYENEITLPLHTRLSDADVSRVIETYADSLRTER